MRILMLTAALTAGGAETHLYELCRALQSQGHTVTVGAHRGTLTPRFREAGIRVLPCSIGGRLPLPLALTADFFRLLRFLRRERPQVIHAHARPCALLGWVLSRWTGIPMVTTLHAAYAANPLSRALTRFGEVTLAVSPDLLRHARQRFDQPQKRLLLTRNGIDALHFSPDAAERVPFRVAALCRMEEDAWHGAWLLAQAAPYLYARFPQIQIHLAGAGRCLPRLQRLCRRINADLGAQVLLCVGNVPDPAPLLASAEVAVVSSRAALEALSCGCAVVAAGVYGFGGLLTAQRLPQAAETNFTFRARCRPSVSLITQSVLEYFSMPETQKQRMRLENRAFVLRRLPAHRMARDALTAYRLACAPQLLLHGYYGFDNFGDESSRQAICAQLHRNGYRVLVAAHRPRAYQRQTGEKTCGRWSLWRLRDCRALLFGGGSLLQNETSCRSLCFYLGWSEAALRWHRRVLFYANGIGPLSRGFAHWAVGRLLRHPSCRILCRDTRSFFLARSMGAASCGRCEDAVYLRPMRCTAADLPQAFSTTLWKNTQKGAKKEEKAEKNALFSLFSPCAGRYCSAVAMERACVSAVGERFFLPLQPCDLPLCRALADRFGGVVLPLPDHAALCALLSHPSLHCAYGQRYHFLLYAKRLGVPFVALSASPKVLGLLE